MSDIPTSPDQPLQPPRLREDFFATVRKALGHDQTPRTPPPRPGRQEAVIRQVATDDSGRVERWIKCARANGMSAERTAPDQLVAAIQKQLTAHGVQRVMVNFSAWPVEPLATTLHTAGLTVHRWTEPECGKNVFACDAAVTDCRYGLADSGSIMVWSDAGFGRSSTLTVNLHVVILPAIQIVADMVDAMALLIRDTQGLMPSNVVIINGPSKTSDIEMNLVTGVHGPKFVAVMVVDS